MFELVAGVILGITITVILFFAGGYRNRSIAVTGTGSTDGKMSYGRNIIGWTEEGGYVYED